MAKGRKLTTSRSERLLGSYGYGNGYGSAAAAGGDDSELGEEDVWSVVDAGANRGEDIEISDGSHLSWSPRAASGAWNSGRTHRRLSRMDGEGRQVGGLSLAFDDSNPASPRIVHQFRGNDRMVSTVASPHGGVGHHMAASAPVNVPDWSKIYRVDSVESMHDSDEDRDSETMIPPHEYLYARSRKSEATSVFEGVGRTLKGRDMRRVRDAVWSQTGFDG